MSQINSLNTRPANFYSSTTINNNSTSPLRRVKSLSDIPASRQVSPQFLSEITHLRNDNQRLREIETNTCDLQKASPSESYLTNFEKKRQAYLKGSTAKRAEARQKFKAPQQAYKEAQQANKEALADHQKTDNQRPHQEIRNTTTHSETVNQNKKKENTKEFNSIKTNRLAKIQTSAKAQRLGKLLSTLKSKINSKSDVLTEESTQTTQPSNLHISTTPSRTNSKINLNKISDKLVRTNMKANEIINNYNKKLKSFLKNFDKWFFKALLNELAHLLCVFVKKSPKLAVYGLAYIGIFAVASPYFIIIGIAKLISKIIFSDPFKGRSGSSSYSNRFYQENHGPSRSYKAQSHQDSLQRGWND